MGGSLGSALIIGLVVAICAGSLIELSRQRGVRHLPSQTDDEFISAIESLRPDLNSDEIIRERLRVSNIIGIPKSRATSDLRLSDLREMSMSGLSMQPGELAEYLQRLGGQTRVDVDGNIDKIADVVVRLIDLERAKASE